MIFIVQIRRKARARTQLMANFHHLRARVGKFTQLGVSWKPSHTFGNSHRLVPPFNSGALKCDESSAMCCGNESTSH